MSALSKEEKEQLFSRIKLMANQHRFEILLLTQEDSPSIAELSAKIKLAYNKCADYVTLLEKQGLITKIRDGREIHIKSNVTIHPTHLQFR
jgi:hypothetical protein